jgi:regulator of protease activity HflC (stomatin/prohibitin superfamily)
MASITRKRFYTGTCYVFGGFIGVVAVILAITLMALTVDKVVEQNEYAVGYNTYTMEFTKVYEQGKHTIAVGEDWIILQRTLREFKDEIQCLSKDKVLLDISVSIQYQYVEDDLINIIMRDYGGEKNYKKMIHNRAISSIMESCLLFNAEQYYIERSSIDAAMYNTLYNKINEKDIGTTIEFLQLTNIAFPDDFNTVIEEKQNIEQTSLTALNDRASIITQANTEYLEALREADVNIINANKTANIIINKAETEATSQEKLWSDRAFGYTHALSLLNFNSTDIIKYIEYDNVRGSTTLYTT